jgi:sterol desaturase/sphingolipid hydroxylase (fatty acid hydroxylase superfamily)
MDLSLLALLDRFVGWVFEELASIPRGIFNPDNRLYWVFLLSALILAAISYRRYHHSSGLFPIKAFLEFVFPKKVYLHPSAIIDYKIYISYRFISPFVVGPVVEVVSSAWVASYTNSLLTTAVTQWQGLPVTLEVVIAFTIVYALLSDFLTYVNHRLHHETRLLWPIHRVHHSAEVLTPITLFRKHPLYNVVRQLISVPVIGLFQGLVVFAFLGKIDPVTILGINAVSALFRIFGANLRHTHIWFSFGPILNHIFISPAHHQIHHSARPEHWNRNYGEVFALWDWMFGTLILPSEEIRKNLIFGLGSGKPQYHSTLAEAYLEPLKSMYEVVKQYCKPSRLAS